MLKVLSASPSAYSANPKSILSNPPSLTGSAISLVSIMQVNQLSVIVSFLCSLNLLYLSVLAKISPSLSLSSFFLSLFIQFIVMCE